MSKEAKEPEHPCLTCGSKIWMEKGRTRVSAPSPGELVSWACSQGHRAHTHLRDSAYPTPEEFAAQIQDDEIDIPYGIGDWTI